MKTSRDWTVWAFLSLAAATCFCCAVIIAQNVDNQRSLAWLKHQQEIVKDQNQWSIEDRANLHEQLKNTREMLKRLEARQ